MLRSFNGKKPKIHPSAFIHPACEIIGDVRIGAYASVWPGVVIRADTDKIVIGERTNIQDGTIIHCDKGVPTILGKGIVVGHRVLLHGACIADGVLVGMGAIVMAAAIGRESLIGAGALVIDATKVPPRSLVLGSPAKVKRKLTPQEIAKIRKGESNYLKYQKLHKQTSFVVGLS